MAADILDNLIVKRLSQSTGRSVGELSEAAIAAGYAKPPDIDHGHHRAGDQVPTGLHIPLMDVAIPHADAEWAIKPSVTIGIMEKPVAFKPMDGQGGDVMAGLVFMLTIEEPKDHIEFLRAFSSVMGTSEILVEFAKNGKPESLIKKIKKKMVDRIKN